MPRIRIIAGDMRGRYIDAPDSSSTRPTTNRVREAVMSSIFSVLGSFDGLHVLDAFAGSGAMGFEALSRGAADVAFVDADSKACKTIGRNAVSLGLPENEVTVLKRDTLASGLPKGRHPYGLVFLDPPYKTPHDDVMSLILNGREQGIFGDGCLFVYEHDGDFEELDDDFLAHGDHDGEDGRGSGPMVIAERAYGKTKVTYLRF